MRTSEIKDVKADGDYLIEVEGVTVPLQYKAGDRPALLIFFHGAVDRSSTKLPRHTGFLPGIGNRHQISIADPTLTLGEELGIGWFAGGRDLPVQRAIRQVIADLSRTLRIPRRIYVGGSAGGFAALYYSWYDPGSMCIASNPQVDIGAYYPGLVRRYLDMAWPGAEKVVNAAREGVCLNVANLYAKGFENLVIYLQSSGDAAHFRAQLPTFMRAAAPFEQNFILNAGYWGIPSHSSSVPPLVIKQWVQAAISAPKVEKQAILDSYAAIIKAGQAVAVAPKPASGPAPVSDADLRIAALLRDYHLPDGQTG